MLRNLKPVSCPVCQSSVERLGYKYLLSCCCIFVVNCLFFYFSRDYDIKLVLKKMRQPVVSK